MDGGPEIEGRHHHTGHRLLDVVLGASAIFISLISLFIAVQHGKTMEKLVEANTWPFVDTAQSNQTESGEHNNQLLVTNMGVGPAKLETFEVFYNKKPMPGPDALMKACCGVEPSDNPPFVISSVMGRILPARERITYLAVKEQTDPKAYAAFGAAMPHIDARICYCSVFDDCYVNEGPRLRPRSVKTCPTPAVPYHN